MSIGNDMGAEGKRKKKILFISHDASRTGATILLLNLLELLHESNRNELTVLFRKAGPLETRFSKVARIFIWMDNKYQPKPGLFQRRVSGRKLDQTERMLKEIEGVDIIFNNTITNGELLQAVGSKCNAKVVSYIHELQMASAEFATAAGIDLTLSLSQELLVPSQAVKNFLEERYRVDPRRIISLSYYIPVKTPVDSLNQRDRKEVLEVGGCGTTDWRKGIDIFLSVAKRLKLTGNNDFHFIWKGGNANSKEYKQCVYDLEKAGLEEMVRLLPSDDDMERFYENIDVLFLSSREDPYPLVVLEAASFGKPVICFEGAGGAPEFVRGDAGTIVPYMDIDAAVQALLKYHDEPYLLQEQGQEARYRVATLHGDKTRILRQLEHIINGE